MISFRRGSILFTKQIWWQIGGPGLVALILAPVIFLFLHWLARLTGFPYLQARSRFE